MHRGALGQRFVDLWSSNPAAFKVQAGQGCASVKGKWQNGKETRNGWWGFGQKSECKRGDWEPQVSLLIYQLCSWQPRGTKWMCGPQGSGTSAEQWRQGDREWGESKQPMERNWSVIPTSKCAIVKQSYSFEYRSWDVGVIQSCNGDLMWSQ